jgi:ribonuclease HI
VIARAGLGVYFGANHALNAAEPVKGKPTNNVGEIQAAIKAIESANSAQVPRLNIFTDSQYVMNSICKWMPNWKKRNWMLAGDKEVKNKIDFQRLDKLVHAGSMVIKWSYVPAHKGHHGNEEADRLAKEGARKYV